MSAEAIMPLTFATFFICGVKGLTNLTQRTCVNLLLKGTLSEKAKEGDFDVLPDTDCSNFAKGKRKLSTEIQIELNKLDPEEIFSRLKQLDIRDFAMAAGALKLLVNNSSLSEKEKETLLKAYQEDQELKFIAEVFLRSVREDNGQQLTLAQIDTLKEYRNSYALANNKSGTTGISGSQKLVNRTDIDLHERADENLSWMDNYIPASMVKKLDDFAEREVAIRHGIIELPDEYSRMVYILKYALREPNVRKYSMHAFVEALDIDAASNSLREGTLEYWQFEGEIKAIEALCKKLNFSDACGFVLQPIGTFEIAQIDSMEKTLRGVSNANVSMCSPLIYKDAPVFKLILLVHRSERKAKEQKLDTDHDNTRVYEKKRNPENGSP